MTVGQAVKGCEWVFRSVEVYRRSGPRQRLVWVGLLRPVLANERIVITSPDRGRLVPTDRKLALAHIEAVER